MTTKADFVGVSKADIRRAVRNGAASGDVTKANQARMVLQEARKHGILNADEFEELKRENEL